MISYRGVNLGLPDLSTLVIQYHLKRILFAHGAD